MFTGGQDSGMDTVDGRIEISDEGASVICGKTAPINPSTPWKASSFYSFFLFFGCSSRR